MQEGIIDLDDFPTWPDDVREMVRRVSGSADDLVDLWLPDEDVVFFDSMVRRYRVRAYHATRLLDEDRADILRVGLTALSRELVEARLARAAEDGLVSSTEHQFFLANHAFSRGAAENREGRVCLILGDHVLREEPAGVRPLLSTWGGEGIYMSLDRRQWDRLGQLGRPSIVAVDLDLDATWTCFPDLLKVFALSAGGRSSIAAEIHYMRSVPANSIRAIWQPGDDQYDQYPELPRV
ncbi:MAG: hypothetical protein O2822_01890 [Chloroflexi bacterium]|nr:hypothetical protein [Chloroflexota bacterium]